MLDYINEHRFMVIKMSLDNKFGLEAFVICIGNGLVSLYVESLTRGNK